MNITTDSSNTKSAMTNNNMSSLAWGNLTTATPKETTNVSHGLVLLLYAIIIIVVGTVANGLVVFVMRNKVFINLPLAVYFTAMAVSDMVVLITTNFQHVVWHITSPRFRYFGQTSLCTTVGYVYISICLYYRNSSKIYKLNDVQSFLTLKYQKSYFLY